MTDLTGIDWEDAFSNARYISGGESYPERWQSLSKRFRDTADVNIDVSYGNAPREKLDIFRPCGTPRGLAIFIHGGYWSAFDKSSWSNLAEGALKLGWAVALPGYTLAPEIRISEITAQIGRAVAKAADMVPGPVHLCGHSAGGHLAVRMVCEDSPLPPPVLARVRRVISISGLHDLRPLRCHSMNDTLRLDAAEAAAESPILHSPYSGVSVIAWLGALERPEFLRQSALLAEAWGTSSAPVPLIVEPNRHHFNVIDGLCDPDHALTQCFVGGELSNDGNPAP